MAKTKQVWLCVENSKVVKMIAVKELCEEQKGITIKDLIESYKEYKLRLLIA